MNKTDLKRLALARDIETAFKNHMGTDSFPTAEWPAVALAFADVVMKTDVRPEYADGLEVLENAQEFMRARAKLDAALADLMGL